MRWYVILALIRRSFRGTFGDQGRVTELLIFPLSFLIIWGLFFMSNLVAHDVAGKLLVINLIWSAAGTFQSQANLTMMFDLWAREFANILRQGVRIGEMVVAHLIFATILGVLNISMFLLFILYGFGGGAEQTWLFIELFPIYYLGAMGLAALFGGVVIRFGKSYAFVAWTGLQVIITISSPFSPVATLPSWLQPIVHLSPFTYVFEYVRFQRTSDYWMGLLLAVVYLVLGWITAVVLFRQRRAGRGLMEV